MGADEMITFSLPNGIRTAFRPVTGTKIVHCGLILNIGSRDEAKENEGIAHFWEHMAFKGTKKRRAYHIINRLDSVGGELNAFTTKEKVAFFASVSDIYFEKAVDLLKDITFDSVFPEKQIDRERNVILEELSMYKDSPEDEIIDEFDEVIFGDHPLGHNILGDTGKIQSFKRADFTRFLNQHLNSGEIVFSVVGNIDKKKVERLSQKYFSNIPSIENPLKREKFDVYIPQREVREKNLEQALCSIGRVAYHMHSEKKHIFSLLNNMLGGPAMNSRLNISLREKKGFVYSVESNYTAYSDTGLFSIFFGTRPERLNKTIDLTFKELRDLKERKLGVNQLSRAKEQLMGQLMILEENYAHQMLKMGKNILDFQEIQDLELKINKIKSITSSEILEVANEMFDEDQLSTLKYIPE